MTAAARVVVEGAKEIRPGRDGRSTVSFPPEWIKANGPPPEGREALRAWVKLNLLDGRIAEARCERPSWLEARA